MLGQTANAFDGGHKTSVKQTWLGVGVLRRRVDSVFVIISVHTTQHRRRLQHWRRLILPPLPAPEMTLARHMWCVGVGHGVRAAPPPPPRGGGGPNFPWEQFSGYHFNYLNKTADGESLDLHLKNVFKKIVFIRSFLFWKKSEKRNEINSYWANVLFWDPLKTPENLKIFWCFQGVSKGKTG